MNRDMAASGPGVINKVELHIHLDGSVRPSTAWELAQKKKLLMPGVSNFLEFERSLEINKPTNLFDFIRKFGLFWPPFEGDLDAIERCAYEFCEDEHYAGVIYAEVRWSPRLALGDKALKQLGPNAMSDVIKRVAHGLQRGESDFGVKTRQILCAIYTKEFNDLREVLQLCQKHYDIGVVGIDLLSPQPAHGIVDECPYVEPIISTYREAAQTGVHRTVHAGEMSNAQAVERAIQIGSERVGHGYHVLQDMNVYQKCLRDQVHFECCPYSSLMTGSVKEFGQTHPIYRFIKDGANISINVDDPTVTGGFVEQDYNLLHSWGVDHSSFLKVNQNACKSCFLDDNGKSCLLKQLQNSRS